MRVNSISSYSMKSNSDLTKANTMSNSLLNETSADSVNFGTKVKAPKTKSNAVLNVLKKVGGALAIVGFAILSVLGSLLPGDSVNDKKIKTGINDKDTCEYKGTSSGDLYYHYSK